MHSRPQAAFSLIELLVVVAVVAVLASLVLPAAGMVRDAARTADCLSRMRQVGIASGIYVSENRGLLFEAQTAYHPESTDTLIDPIWGMWPGRLMPYLESDSKGSTVDRDNQCWNRFFNCPSGNWTIAEIQRWRRKK